MIVIQKVVTDEGEEIPFQLTDLECGTEVDGENDRVFLLWPVTIGHKVRFSNILCSGNSVVPFWENWHLSNIDFSASLISLKCWFPLRRIDFSISDYLELWAYGFLVLQGNNLAHEDMKHCRRRFWRTFPSCLTMPSCSMSILHCGLLNTIRVASDWRGKPALRDGRAVAPQLSVRDRRRDGGRHRGDRQHRPGTNETRT